jgi:hypothetical protein
VDAFEVVPGDILFDGFNDDPRFEEIIHPALEIRLRTAQLQNHEALLLRQDIGLEDVEAQVKIFNQPVHDRLVPILLGKMENDLLGSHGSSPERVLLST